MAVGAPWAVLVVVVVVVGMPMGRMVKGMDMMGMDSWGAGIRLALGDSPNKKKRCAHS